MRSASWHRVAVVAGLAGAALSAAGQQPVPPGIVAAHCMRVDACLEEARKQLTPLRGGGIL